MQKLSALVASLALCAILTGCVHKLVTVPAKAAYGVTKGVVKGTTAVAKAVIPGDSKKSKDDQDDDRNDDEE